MRVWTIRLTKKFFEILFKTTYFAYKKGNKN